MNIGIPVGDESKENICISLYADNMPLSEAVRNKCYSKHCSHSVKYSTTSLLRSVKGLDQRDLNIEVTLILNTHIQTSGENNAMKMIHVDQMHTCIFLFLIQCILYTTNYHTYTKI